MPKIFFALFFALFVSPPTMAVQAKSFDVGIAALSHGLNKVAKDSTGKTSILGTTYWNFHFQTHLLLTSDFLFSPAVVWMPDFLYPAKAPGSEIKTSFLILKLPLTYNINNAVDVNGGLALLSYQIKGPGGTTTLSNGNSTSSFALPGETQTPRTVGLLLGAGYNAEPFRVSLETITEGLLSSKKRTFSLMFTFSYSLFKF